LINKGLAEREKIRKRFLNIGMLSNFYKKEIIQKKIKRGKANGLRLFQITLSLRIFPPNQLESTPFELNPPEKKFGN
jgi:hypothetical protein